MLKNIVKKSIGIGDMNSITGLYNDILVLYCLFVFYRCSYDNTYEWFKGYDYFRDSIRGHFKENDKILMLGCGNSRK